MYLRHTTVRKDGKTHSYWRLVRSVRRGRKVVQETVAQLGELDAQGRARARTLALRLTGRDEQYELFEAPAGRSEPVAVRLDQIRLERARRFGDVWLAWRLWRALALDRFCSEHLVEGREQVPWSAMAAILVIARLCEPASELHIAEDWYRRTALDDLLGVPAERINDDRLYRALDRLLPHKRALEVHLKERLGALFELDYELLLYDVTSTYFEGQAEGNALARRGYSRDHRPDCKQVCIGLVVTRDGVPLGYEVFAGNRTDVTTVEEIVTTMERRYGQGAPRVGDGSRYDQRREHRLAAEQRTELLDRNEQERAEEVRLSACRSAGLAAGARRGRGQGVCRSRRQRDVPAGAFGRAAAEGTSHACSLLRADRDSAGEPATAHRAGTKPDRSQRHRASDRAAARPQLACRRALCDPSRR